MRSEQHFMFNSLFFLCFGYRCFTTAPPNSDCARWLMIVMSVVGLEAFPATVSLFYESLVEAVILRHDAVQLFSPNHHSRTNLAVAEKKKIITWQKNTFEHAWRPPLPTPHPTFPGGWGVGNGGQGGGGATVGRRRGARCYGWVERKWKVRKYLNGRSGISK